MNWPSLRKFAELLHGPGVGLGGAVGEHVGGERWRAKGAGTSGSGWVGEATSPGTVDAG